MVDAVLGRPAVFILKEGRHGERFLEKMREKELLN